MSHHNPDSEIYLDHHGSTPVDARVMTAMLPFFEREYGNPHASDHASGWRSASAIDDARVVVAELIGADPDEVVFTSGATEADNLALLGAARAAPAERRRILIGATEHLAVLGPALALAAEGFAVQLLPVDRRGHLDLDAVRALLRPDVAIISVMLVNNEIGTVGPVAEIAAMAAAQGVLVHTDAAQAPCALNLDVATLGVDLLSLSAHKAYGPKGIGALYVRRGTRLHPLMFGGSQEAGLRPGTLPTPLVVGFAEACRIILREGNAERARIRMLRDQMERHLLDNVPGARVLGKGGDRHPGNLSVWFPGCDADALLGALQLRLSAATGSACSSGLPSPSHVLTAIGLSPSQAAEVVRLGIGRGNTLDEVVSAAELIAASAKHLLRAAA